jgi:hypothetical protein
MVRMRILLGNHQTTFRQVKKVEVLRKPDGKRRN